MSLKDKVVLVTGASRGIGKSIAMHCIEAGAIVIGTATSENGAASITDYFKTLGHTAGQGIVLNVTDPASVEAALKEIQTITGSMPQVLVNNAGVTADNLFLRLQEEDWSRIIDTNLSGAYRLMKACLRPMVKQKWGRIVNISSVVAFTGNPGQANYSAAKSGLLGLSKSLALEVASRGITVNTIAPGFIQTDMTDQLTEAQKEKLLERIPMKRMGAVEDIAQTVQFLASDAASYITGETIHVNGGMLMH